MPHTRSRYVLSQLQKMLEFWPVVGVLGLRQSGKTTLVRDLLGIANVASLDEAVLREEANSSAKTFLARQSRPLVIDEAQKAPPLFDAIKLEVDKKRRPGQFVLTGSAGFSTRLGINESLTGRIGLIHLLPMVYGELNQLPFEPMTSLVKGIDAKKARASIDDVARSMQSGGMPGVAFIRDKQNQALYWSSWIETTVTRDLARFFTRAYDPDMAQSILERMAAVMAEGELPSLKHFKQPARKLRNYLSAMEEIFLVKRIPSHEMGKAKEAWLFGDGGLAAHLMGGNGAGTAVQLTLIRHFLQNEWAYRNSELQKVRHALPFYRSAQGSPIDAVIEGIPVLVVADISDIARRLSWVERPLRGAMKTLGSKTGIVVAPVEQTVLAKSNDGIAIVPWAAWC